MNSWVLTTSAELAAAVGPPWLVTMSGGSSPSGPRNAAFCGAYKSPNAVLPAVVGNSTGFATAMSAGSNVVDIDSRSTVVTPVSGSNSTMAKALVGEATRSTTPPPSTARLAISLKGTSMTSATPGFGPSR